MFGWGISVAQNASRLVLTVPLHWVEWLLSLPVVGLVLLLGFSRRRPWTSTALVVLLTAGYGYLTYASELTLDRVTDTATIREFQFFHWQTTTFALRDVVAVTVTRGMRRRQIWLEFRDGSSRSLTFADTYDGKAQAACQVNTFLGVSCPL